MIAEDAERTLVAGDRGQHQVLAEMTGRGRRELHRHLQTPARRFAEAFEVRGVHGLGRDVEDGPSAAQQSGQQRDRFGREQAGMVEHDQIGRGERRPIHPVRLQTQHPRRGDFVGPFLRRQAHSRKWLDDGRSVALCRLMRA